MSAKSSNRILGLFVAAATLTSPAFAEGPYRLAYRFQPGEFLHYEMEEQADVFTQNGTVKDRFDRPVESKSFQQTQLLKSYRVVIVDEDGAATLEPIIEKIRMSSRSGDNAAISFDSTKDEAPPKEFEKVAGTIGRALSRFQVAANGKLIKVTMLVDDVPKSFSEAAEKADPSINFLVVFPDKPINIGEKWNEKFDTPIKVSGGLSRPVQLIRSFELIKVVENVATIRYRTRLLTAINDPEILTQLVQQTPTGLIDFDLEQGRILQRAFEVDNKVIGSFGPETLLHARGQSVERLIVEKTPPRVSGVPLSQNSK